MALNTNIAHQLAADPKVNVWVAASAGTGKTKLLTDRLLNLMIHGTEPERILCLTFTQAAAAEMQHRLMQRLAYWTTLETEELEHELSALLNRQPTIKERLSARQLFLKVLDTPGSIKIQTIHGFCKALLSRFPLEAQLPPVLTALDEQQAEDILLQARDQILKKRHEEDLQAAFQILTTTLKETSFQELLTDILSQRARLRDLLYHWQTPELAEEALKTALDLQQDISLFNPNLLPEQITQWHRFCPYHDLLLELNQAKPHPTLSQWLLEPENRSKIFEEYCRLFLTSDGRISSRPKIKCPEEAERVFTIHQHLNALRLAQQTFALYLISAQIFYQYQALKLAQGKLDYDDLIEQASTLLSQPGISSWILYKLDGGIDHILVDEAQDTNPAQWRIIQLMAEEFFTSDRRDRTLFVVGDAKQSIYSFQGANPKDFIEFRDVFSMRLQHQNFTWRDVELDISFRSSPAILQLVDHVFADPSHQHAILLHTRRPLQHRPHRVDAQGCIEVWPAILEEEKESPKLKPWPLPYPGFSLSNPVQKLASMVAEQVETILQKGLYLPATKASAQPKDILILLRSRSSIVQELIRAFKRKNIPISGADRLVLQAHLAVEDLVALAQFALLPSDDLSLATVLKSPLIGLGEEELFELAHFRSGNLWSEIKKDPTTQAYQILSDLLAQVDYLTPYEWFQRALIHHDAHRKLVGRLGLEVEDIIHEFLNYILDYQATTGGNLQQFIHNFSTQSLEIKRDSNDQHANQVKIMTVHGAKGLQAPIVILLDHLDGRQPIDRILWGSNSEGKTNLILIRPSKENDTALTSSLKQRLDQKREHEDKRLLYVALTRAQDHFFVGGWGKTIAEDSWYALIKKSHDKLEHAPRHYQLTSGPVTPLSSATPDWISKVTPQSPKAVPPRELSNQTAIQQAATRGIIIHRLLEVLVDFPTDQRRFLAHQVLQQFDQNLLEWEEELAKILSLFEHPEWHSFFGSNSQAEVDIHGIVAHQAFHGRIDRLVIHPDELWILDYKSTSNPPTSVENLPLLYHQQLQHYQECLIPLYPTKKIRCFLLWTENLTIMEVTPCPPHK
jgi:ATP-dependent helicase/nuclease subunit A